MLMHIHRFTHDEFGARGALSAKGDEYDSDEAEEDAVGATINESDTPEVAASKRDGLAALRDPVRRFVRMGLLERLVYIMSDKVQSVCHCLHKHACSVPDTTCGWLCATPCSDLLPAFPPCCCA